jgi:hypothetical protein
VNEQPLSKWLRPHPNTALEYWFFKVNAGPVALIVDWIARRRKGEGVVRASIHSPIGRAVIFANRQPLFDEHSLLTTQRTAGQVGNVVWDLSIEIKSEWIAPDIFPAALLRMTDLTLVSAPVALFTGWIRHGDRQFELAQARGMLSHYWGRALAAEWWWVSANQFDREDVAVECTVLRTGVWGIPIRLPLAYLYLSQAEDRKLSIAPFELAKVSGGPDEFEIQFSRPGQFPITLIARGRDYGNFGDGIVNTLVGDLEIREGGKLIAAARGTAGLERRQSITSKETNHEKQQ